VRRPRRTYCSAAERWAGVGPYYAMFPSWFADAVVARHSRPGDVVLDPFAGRGTAVFSAASQDRIGLGIEINPVGWVYSNAKLRPAAKEAVAARIEYLGTVSRRYQSRALATNQFLKLCFAPEVRRFLLAARAELDWQRNGVDRTLMALLLVHLHGKPEASLSNQLRQTKAMSPDYAIRWWRARALRPPDHSPVEFMRNKLEWRYAKGILDPNSSRVYLGDSMRVMSRLSRGRFGKSISGGASLILTSPPYHNLANYHYDQWLRLWLLGGPPSARRPGHRFRGKFEGYETYATLLRSVFRQSAAALAPNGIVYVRTSLRSSTFRANVTALEEAFPRHSATYHRRPFNRPTQTHLFGDSETKRGEVDIVLMPK
jgi:hypothetical protein